MEGFLGFLFFAILIGCSFAIGKTPRGAAAATFIVGPIMLLVLYLGVKIFDYFN